MADRELGDRIAIECSRCGRETQIVYAGHLTVVPDGWEGTWREPVCPGCQFAEWHPHCLGAITADGDPVAGIPTAEVDPGTLMRCDYVDLTVSVLDREEWPTGWRCPRCGGSSFDWVHRDYPASGLHSEQFGPQAGHEPTEPR